jgi:hypothetical protein
VETVTFSDAQLGPVAFAGEYDFYVRMEALAFFLKAALGGGASVVDAGAVATGYTHTITPTDGTLPWISIEEQIGNGLLNLKYTDNKCNTFHMEADSNGFLMGTAGFVGLTQAIDGSPTLRHQPKRWDTSGLMTGPTVTVTWNAVAASCEVILVGHQQQPRRGRLPTRLVVPWRCGREASRDHDGRYHP